MYINFCCFLSFVKKIIIQPCGTWKDPCSTSTLRRGCPSLIVLCAIGRASQQGSSGRSLYMCSQHFFLFSLFLRLNRHNTIVQVNLWNLRDKHTNPISRCFLLGFSMVLVDLYF